MTIEDHDHLGPISQTDSGIRIVAEWAEKILTDIDHSISDHLKDQKAQVQPNSGLKEDMSTS